MNFILKMPLFPHQIYKRHSSNIFRISEHSFDHNCPSPKIRKLDHETRSTCTSRSTPLANAKVQPSFYECGRISESQQPPNICYKVDDNLYDNNLMLQNGLKSYVDGSANLLTEFKIQPPYLSEEKTDVVQPNLPQAMDITPSHKQSSLCCIGDSDKYMSYENVQEESIPLNSFNPYKQNGHQCPECLAGKSGHIRHIGRWRLVDS